MSKHIVNIIGAGLAGSEAAYQLLSRGVEVHLYEMKPEKYSPAHKSQDFCELVCSNSLKSDDVLTAGGLLKAELRKLNSLVIDCADKTKVPAGSALAVDREKFSAMVTEKLKSFPNLHLHYGEVTSIPNDYPTIIATGPLTSDGLIDSLLKAVGSDNLYFFDAIAPIVSYDSIDFNIAYIKDRYDKGNGDYINCPFTKEEYLAFYNELINGEIVKLKDFENSKVFEGCMPVEVMAKRGEDSLRFGPLKPVGLRDPKTGVTPYAVVQLRKETNENDFYNIVGFQTNLVFKEQKRIFRMIPGLQNVEFLRYGTMHKNTYISAPNILNKHFQCKNNENLFIAGQISGVEGYIESIASGLMAGINMWCKLNQKDLIDFGKYTIMGALSHYISSFNGGNFQPMSSNMGLINYGEIHCKDKKQKNKILSDRSLEYIGSIASTINVKE